MPDDLGRADLPEPGDPALAEWLEGASCGPRVKALAVRAADAASRGASAAGWRAAVPDLTQGPDASTPPTAQHARRQGITVARNIARHLRGQPLQPCRHRDLGLAVDLGGTQAMARPLGRHLSAVPAQLVTRGYHLYELPSPRARLRTAADWPVHAALGDDFTRLELPDPMSGMLAGQEPVEGYLSAADARQTAAAIPAHDREGWPA